MSKHTPGPWAHVSVTGGWDGVAEDANRNSVICTLSLNNPANASLIAAAPDLLAAAELALSEAEGLIYDQLDGTKEFESAFAALQPVRDAIAKARGEA